MAWCDVVEPRTLRECRIALGQSAEALPDYGRLTPYSPPALGVGARMRAGLRASNRRARHLPMRYETGLPSSVIRFRTLHASNVVPQAPIEQAIDKPIPIARELITRRHPASPQVYAPHFYLRQRSMHSRDGIRRPQPIDSECVLLLLSGRSPRCIPRSETDSGGPKAPSVELLQDRTPASSSSCALLSTGAFGPARVGRIGRKRRVKSSGRSGRGDRHRGDGTPGDGQTSNQR